MKRQLSFVLAIALLLGVLAGCSGSGGTDPGQTSTAPSASSPSPGEAPTDSAGTAEPGSVQLPLASGAELSMFWNFPYASQCGILDYNDVTIYQELEKLTGVHINFIHPTNAQESFNIMVAGGDLSDMIFCSASYWINGMDAAIEDGYIVDLNENKDICLNYYTYLETMPEDVIRSCYTDTGYMPGFSQMRTYAQPPWSGPVIRQDWLDDLGLETPTTFDELTNVARQFRDNKGTTATVMLNFTSVFETLSQSFNAGYNFGREYFQIDNVVKYGPITDECKEYITMLKLWYDEGILAPDFYTMAGGPDSLPVINNGKTGIWREAYPEYNSRNMSNIDPNCRIVAIPLPVQSKGEVTHIAQSYSYNSGVMYGYVSAEGADPELAMKWLDYGWTEEGTFLVNWGLEGYTFTYIDGEPVFTDIILKNEEKIAIQMIMHKYVMQVGPWPTIWDRDKPGCTEDEWAAFDTWHNSTDYAYNMPEGITMSADENTEYSALYNDIKTYTDEQLISFVIGYRSLDEWDDYVEQVKSMKIDRCVELKQASLNRFLARG